MDNETVNQYFQSMNSVAKRLWEDIETCKESYEDAWNYLNPEEQNQVVNESIIHPEAILKYSLLGTSESQITGVAGRHRVIEDELGARWEDEHSAPFSWFTTSQLNLDKLSNQEGKVSLSGNRERDSVQTQKQVQLKVAPKVLPKPVRTDLNDTDIHVKVDELEVKPISSLNEDGRTIELGTSNLTLRDSVEEDTELNQTEEPPPDIPRSGFEFLDNW